MARRKSCKPRKGDHKSGCAKRLACALRKAKSGAAVQTAMNAFGFCAGTGRRLTRAKTAKAAAIAAIDAAQAAAVSAHGYGGEYGPAYHGGQGGGHITTTIGRARRRRRLGRR